jgi:hypothetical protein
MEEILETSDWQKQIVTWEMLRSKQAYISQAQPIFDWLKDIGIVPRDVERVNVAPAKMKLDPLHIEAGYIASCAYEWDSWTREAGDDWHYPVQFLDAIEAELEGNEANDTIREILSALGQREPEPEEEVVNA